MFDRLIASPVSPLTTQYLSEHGKSLYREPDYSLQCLGIAVLKPRLENYNGVDGAFCSYDSSIVPLIKNASGNTSAPCFYYFTNVSSEEMQEELKKTFTEIGMKEIPAIKAYVKQELKMFNFSAFTDGHVGVVLAPSGSYGLYHLCLAFLPLYFSDIFKEKPLTQEETAIFKSLTNKTSTKFVQLLSEALQPLRSQIMSAELRKLFSGFRERRIAGAKNLIDAIDNEIAMLDQKYRNTMERREEAIIRYEGMKAMDGDYDEDKETIEYLSTCPRLHNITYKDGILSFGVDTYLTNFDPSKWKTVSTRRGIYDSYRIENDNPFASSANRKLFLNELFSDNPKLRIHMRGYFYLYLNRSYAESIRGENPFMGCDHVLSECITNPHLKIHACLGRNKDQIMSCLRDGDIVTAVECCIAAAGSVNILETDLTFRPFLQELMTCDKQVILNENGESMSPVEALNWLIMSKTGDSK